MLGANRLTYVMAMVACALFACTKASNGSGNTNGGTFGGTGSPTGTGQPGATPGAGTTPGAPASTGGGNTGLGAGSPGNTAGPVGGGAGTGSTIGGTGGSSGNMTTVNGGSGGMTGGAAGSGAAGAMGVAGGPSTMTDPTYKPPCTTMASQVAILGDSYLNYTSHTFGADMAAQAGETWRMEAIAGYSMASGGIGLIPPEFDSSITGPQGPDIKAVVMDGGGNDILLADTVMFPGGDNCKNEMSPGTDPVCQMIIQKAFDASKTLMTHMADKGVRDVVFIFYPHVPNNTVFGGTNPNASLDYSLPMAKELCDQAVTNTGGKLRCHFLDLVPIFDGHMDWYALLDIHENSMGSAAMAKAVWQIMKDNCIAQKPASGCCTP